MSDPQTTKSAGESPGGEEFKPEARIPGSSLKSDTTTRAMTAKELSAYLDEPLWKIEKALINLAKKGLIANAR